MLQRNTLNAVLAFAMEKYAGENNGKNGILKSDVREIVKLHGGDQEDVTEVMTLALRLLASEASECEI